jgi:hypothetical protein
VLSDTRVDSKYRRGEIVDRFSHEIRSLEIYRGWSRGLSGGWARRFLVGWTGTRDVFGAPPEPAYELVGEVSVPLPALLGEVPPDRTLSTVWVGYERGGGLERL